MDLRSLQICVFPILNSQSKQFDTLVQEHGWQGCMDYETAKKKL
jgi:hypothetical protein